MPRYTDESLDRVRDAIDIVALVGANTDLRRKGPSRYEGLCPFHEERTPSFGIDPVKKLYHCFGCGAGGDAITFVQETEGLDFGGAMEMLADRFGVQLEAADEDPRAAERRARRARLYELLERTTAFYERVLWDADEAADARAYLLGRGLEEPTLRAFRVGYAPSRIDTVLMASRRAGFTEAELSATGLVQTNDRGRPYDRFRERVMFPLADLRGRVLGFGARAMRDGQGAKYLNTRDGELYHKGNQLFGADRARAEAAKASLVLVVEGYTDVLALHQAGLTNAVGLMGTALTDAQVAELARMAPTVALALDADAAGQEAMLRAGRVAAGRKLELRVVPMPSGTDPADLVAAEGAEAMSARVARSAPFTRFRVERILAGAELESGDGRDRALADLRGVLGALGPSALREELVQLVAGRLGLSEALVASLADGPATLPGSEPGGDAERPAQRGPRRALDRREETERNFLAMCIALPEAGREALRRVDLDVHFTSELVRRAAAHLRLDLVNPMQGVSAQDSELSTLIAELALRATQQPSDPAALEVQSLQLQTARLEREIVAARGSGDASRLAEERRQVKLRLDDAMDRAMEGSRRA